MILVFTLLCFSLSAMEKKHSDKSTALAKEIANRKVPKLVEKLQEIFSDDEPIPKDLYYSEPIIVKCCTQAHYLPLLRELLESKKLDPNTHWGYPHAYDQFSLLPMALGYKAWENAKLLIAHGADTNLPGAYKDNHPESPIHIVISEENTEMLSLLLQHKGDPNQIGCASYPPSRPLIRLIKHHTEDDPEEKEKSLALIRILLQAGANPTLDDDYDIFFLDLEISFKVRTPLELAQVLGYKDIEKLFQERIDNKSAQINTHTIQ